MKFALRTRTHARAGTLILAAALAAGGALAQSAVPPAKAGPPATTSGQSAPGNHHRHMGHHDPAKMQARMAKRQAELKATLALMPAQENAWLAYTQAMAPVAQDRAAMHAQRAQLAQLPTPERIDTMRALRTQHMAEMVARMDQRGDATKAFYAALTPVQQKAFDAQASKGGRHGSRMKG